MDTHARFGIFPSWGLSQKLSRIIGPNEAREVSLTAMPLTAELAEKHGFVNHVVEVSELMSKAREVVLAIIKNNQDLVLRYKAVINDGLKLDLGLALALEKVPCSYINDPAEKYLSLIVPAYNEEYRLPGALDETIKFKKKSKMLKRRRSGEEENGVEEQNRTKEEDASGAIDRILVS